MSSYTPVGGDVGSVLRAKAMYDDDEGADKTAQADSVHAVREAPESNVPPTFPTTVGQTEYQSDKGSGREHALGHESRRSHCSQ